MTLAWQANTDIQYFINAYACIMYVASYYNENRQSHGSIVKTSSLWSQNWWNKTIEKSWFSLLPCREVSAQEAIYRILSLPMKQLSRSVVFINTNPKTERIATLKSKDMLSQLEDDDTNVFNKSHWYIPTQAKRATIYVFSWLCCYICHYISLWW